MRFISNLTYDDLPHLFHGICTYTIILATTAGWLTSGITLIITTTLIAGTGIALAIRVQLEQRVRDRAFKHHGQLTILHDQHGTPRAAIHATENDITHVTQLARHYRAHHHDQENG